VSIDPSLLRLLGARPQPQRNSLADLVANPWDSMTSSSDSLAPSLSTLVSSAPISPLGSDSALAGSRSWLDDLVQKSEPVKRKVYFAFDFDDLMRVNNVRQVGKLDRPEVRNARTFYDRSIWDSRDINDIATLKSLMRNCVKYSSVVCVLVGTNTWMSRWVKYEISRSVIDQKGLLVVHINSLRHVRRAPDPLGFNLLNNIGIYHSVEGKFYLYERRFEVVNFLTGQGDWVWRPYSDYSHPVLLPRYLPAPDIEHVRWLSPYVDEYDYVSDEGPKNIGTWIDRAAVRAGR